MSPDQPVLFDLVSVGDRVYLPGRRCIADVTAIYTTNSGKSRYQVEVFCIPSGLTISYARRMWLAYALDNPEVAPAMLVQASVIPPTPPKPQLPPMAVPVTNAPVSLKPKKRPTVFQMPPKMGEPVRIPDLPIKDRPLSDIWFGFYDGAP